MKSARVRGARRRYITLPKPVSPPPPFSDAVLVGDTMYIAGHLGLDPKTGRAPDTVDQEVSLLLEGFKAVLAEARMTMDDLVYVQVFCPDLSLFDQFNQAYKACFDKEYPARAFIGSGPLLFGAHFEMIGIARR